MEPRNPFEVSGVAGGQGGLRYPGGRSDEEIRGGQRLPSPAEFPEEGGVGRGKAIIGPGNGKSTQEGFDPCPLPSGIVGALRARKQLADNMRRYGNLLLPQTLEKAMGRPGLTSSFFPQEIHQKGGVQVDHRLAALAGASPRSRMISSTSSSVEESR